MPFSRAASASVVSVSSVVGGSWTVVGAAGLVERTPTTVSTANVSALLGATCAASPWNGTSIPAVLSVPTYSGGFDSGVAPFWLVFLANAATGTYVLVEVLNGTAAPLAKIGGTGCGGSGTSGRSLPSGTVDSPVAARTVWADAGNGWVDQDPGLTSLTMGAFGGGSYLGMSYPGVWGFVYSSCNPLGGGSTQQPAFVAAVNLTTGLLTAAFSYHVDCAT